MHIYYCDQYVLPLPEGHRFPISKYTLLREQILNHPLASLVSLLVPEAASEEDLLRVHTTEYLQKVFEGQLTARELRRIGFPWSPELVERSRRSVGGTIAAARSAITAGISVNLAGGTHHAYADHGEGFCVFNDAAVAARAIQAEGLAEKILILDLDVHQGNGTASIFSQDQSVFTFSVHGERNFPFHKVPGNLDIGLDDGATDQHYLDAVAAGLERIDLSFSPDLVIYLAGSDPYDGDTLGRLAVSKAGLAERDQLVFHWCSQARCPVAVVMAGGYARKVQDSVDIHFQTVKLAVEEYAEEKYDRLR